MFTFHYHPETRLACGSEPVEFDRMEPGRKIIPAFATDKPPPPMKDGFLRRFDPAADAWEYVPVQMLQDEANG